MQAKKIKNGLIKCCRKKDLPKKLSQLIFIVVIILFSSCQKETAVLSNSNKLTDGSTNAKGHAYGTIISEMVLKWNEAGTKAIANMITFGPPLPPIPESRIYAMINVAMHDALNNIVPRYQKPTH